MSGHLVVGIDRTTHAALAYAAAEAARLDVAVRLVHLHASSPGKRATRGERDDQVGTVLSAAADRVSRWTYNRVPVDCEPGSLPGAEALVSAAHGAALVVVEQTPAGAMPAAGAAAAEDGAAQVLVVPRDWVGSTVTGPLTLRMTDTGWTNELQARVVRADRPVLVTRERRSARGALSV